MSPRRLVRPLLALALGFAAGAFADVVEVPVDLSRDVKLILKYDARGGRPVWALKPGTLSPALARDLKTRIRLVRGPNRIDVQIENVVVSTFDLVTHAYEYHGTHPLTSAELRRWQSEGATFWNAWRMRIEHVAAPEPMDELPLDLHTHYAGEAPSEDLLRLGEQLRLDYPVALLKDINVDLRQVPKHRDAEGTEVITLTPGLLRPHERVSLLRRMSVPPGEIGSFAILERAYRYRDPIAKNRRAVGPTLWAIARHYHAAHVAYAELAISSSLLLGPGFVEAMGEELARIERALGVRLRFLASMQRTRPLDYMRAMSDRVIEHGSADVIAGVDFVGEEVNSVGDFAEIIEKFATFKRERRPHFQIRVHAGESPAFPDNVRLAVEAGATRIGHGLHGVDVATMDLLARRNVVVEMNLGSNIALGYLDRTNTAIQLMKTYLDRGVPVVLGSDGSGILSTDVASEAAEVARAGLARPDIERLIAIQKMYLSKLIRYTPPPRPPPLAPAHACVIELGANP